MQTNLNAVKLNQKMMLRKKAFLKDYGASFLDVTAINLIQETPILTSF